MRVGKNHGLNGKFHIYHAAPVVLHIKKLCRIWVALEHALAHVAYVFKDLFFISGQTQIPPASRGLT